MKGLKWINFKINSFYFSLKFIRKLNLFVMKNFLYLSLSIVVLILFTSFVGKKPVYLEKSKLKNRTTFGKFVYIPSGKLFKSKQDQVSVKGFYMMEAEVNHSDYRKFLNEIKTSGDEEKMKTVAIQDEKWMEENAYKNEPFINTYSSHPAYAEYPVVNISKAAAELYCEWLTQKWKDKNEEFDLKFRLPTKSEWMYAARGGHDLTPYPWGGYYLRNAKGCFLANFKPVSESNIKFNRETKEYEVVTDSKLIRGNIFDGSSITAPVVTYFPNDYGLYNMSGNVSEFLYDGSTKGGSWGSSGYYLQIDAEDEFANLNGEASRFVGFRPMAEIQTKSK